MTTDIKTFLDQLTSDWDPIKTQAIKYFDKDSKIQNDGAAHIYRQPWIAPESYGLILFPPVETLVLDVYKKENTTPIPKLYIDILLQMNGCFVYDFGLFGLPKTMYTTGLLNRGAVEQHDLGTANTDWILEYDLNDEMFHIGDRCYSYDENIGYFIDNQNNFLAIRNNGEILNKWKTFKDFLAEEIDIVEKMMISEKPK